MIVNEFSALTSLKIMWKGSYSYPQFKSAATVCKCAVCVPILLVQQYLCQNLNCYSKLFLVQEGTHEDQ